MTPPLSIEPRATALLVMDFQVAIVDGFAPDKDVLLARTARLIAASRAAGVKVIYVVVSFRRGYPETSPRNGTFSALKGSGRFLAGAEGTAVHAAVAPEDADVVVVKHRVSAFAGTDLDMILRANGVETMVLAGIATSGVVLSTTRHAADADYRLIIAEDCCADRDAEVHRVLTEKVLARQATVVKAQDVIAALPAVST